MFPESVYNGSVFLQHRQYAVPEFFILVIIMAMEWYSVVVLINIFLMTNNGCLTHFSIAMTKDHDHDNLQKREFTGYGLKSFKEEVHD